MGGCQRSTYREENEVGKYPECEKLSQTSKESNKLGAFIDWLNERGIYLAEYPRTCSHYGGKCNLGHKLDIFDCGPGCEDYDEDTEGQLQPTNHTVERLLADYFEVDLAKVEEERRAILEDLQR